MSVPSPGQPGGTPPLPPTGGPAIPRASMGYDVSQAAPRPAPAPAPVPRPMPAPRPVVVAAGAVPSVRLREEELLPEEQLKLQFMKHSPPLLISTVVHMVLIIILGIIALAPQKKDAVALDFSFDAGQQLFDQTYQVRVDNPSTEKAVALDARLPEVEDPFYQPPAISVPTGGTLFEGEGLKSVSISAPALMGRDKGMKTMLIGKYGGDGGSENAVGTGLEWLARNQQRDGSWSLGGPYSSGSSFENVQSATSMALLAFQAAGNSHKEGKYQKNVEAGLKVLLRAQDEEGNIYRGGQRDEWLYTHAQATIVLCELYGMTKDSTIRGATELAVKFCVDAQDSLGGWRYRPRMDSDTSVTGWMVMALQSAKMAGLSVPSPTFARVGEYLDKAATNSEMSEYAYLPGQPTSSLAMTAEALLCREYLGWTPSDKRLIKGAQLILANPPDWKDRDVYYWYYATQMMFHVEGQYWVGWNDGIKNLLVQHQEKAGKEKGSWDPLGAGPDIWAQRGAGGRLYVTCLSLYMLEVYYRHLPLYSELKKKLTEEAK